MTTEELIYEVCGPLEQGAPGGESPTLRALSEIPNREGVKRVLDLGVGHGRSTFSLARALPGADITAVEIHAPFVDEIARRVREAGLSGRVHPLCASMEDLEVESGTIDLVWAEGSIYVIGIGRALALWRPWLRPNGHVAFSDFVWWTERPSKAARAFWESEYPGMASEPAIYALADAAGYHVAAGFRLSKAAHEAYYRPLEARVAELETGAGADLAGLLEGIRREIDVVRRFRDEAGYAFFILRRVDG